MENMESYQRNRARTFTGLLDDEWKDFNMIVRKMMGNGKRAFFTSLLVKKTIENHRNQYEHYANIEQRADHAVNDALKAVNNKYSHGVFNGTQTDIY